MGWNSSLFLTFQVAGTSREKRLVFDSNSGSGMADEAGCSEWSEALEWQFSSIKMSAGLSEV